MSYFFLHIQYIYRYINKCIHICLQMINYIPFLRKLKTIMKVAYRPSSYYKNGFSNITSKKCRSYGCPLRKKKNSGSEQYQVICLEPRDTPSVTFGLRRRIYNVGPPNVLNLFISPISCSTLW
jgi:hypothetical protein